MVIRDKCPIVSFLSNGIILCGENIKNEERPHYYFCALGVNPGGWRGRDPKILGRGTLGVAGSHGGREILLYLIMYRRYVRKWWLLKRNRIICPEAAVNGQFCLENWNFCEIAWKIEFFTRVHDPQISNQIDAAGLCIIGYRVAYIANYSFSRMPFTWCSSERNLLSNVFR